MEMADETQRPSRLIALVFDDMYKADEARAALRRMAGEEKLLELGETAMLVKHPDGKVSVSQDEDVVAKKQHAGHLVGLVAAAVTGTMPMIFLGTVVGRLIGRFTDNGVTDKFVKQVTAKVKPGCSALILLARSDEERREKVFERLRPFNAEVLQSDLPPELERELSEALKQDTEKQA
jgi:uncharacterized membrane protein